MATAKDIMHFPVVSINRDKSIRETAQLMAEKEISCVIVTGDRRTFLKLKELGILTERDVLQRVVAKSLPPEETRAGTIMSKPLITVDVNTSVDEISELLDKKAIRRVAVTEGETVVGIVTIRDVGNALRYSFAKRRKDKEYSRPEYGKPPAK